MPLYRADGGKGCHEEVGAGPSFESVGRVGSSSCLCIAQMEAKAVTKRLEQGLRSRASAVSVQAHASVSRRWRQRLSRRGWSRAFVRERRPCRFKLMPLYRADGGKGCHEEVGAGPSFE